MLSALKRLLRHPVYFLAVVLVLATGMGAAISLYAVADAVLFQPLRVHEADRLVRLFQTDDIRELRLGWSFPSARERFGSVEAFEELAYFQANRTYTNALADGTNRTLAGGVASGNFFNVLGVKPFLGRLLRPSDNVRGSTVVGVLSWEAWRSYFDADYGIVGESITLNQRSVTIVGVAPPGFSGVSLLGSPDVWLPVVPGAGIAMGEHFERELLDTRQMQWLDIVARLAPGATVEQANLALEAACADCTGRVAGNWIPVAIPARDVAVGDNSTERISWLLLGLVGVLQVIVCADVAGLMLVRAEVQRVESGVRMSLGASRARIAFQVLGEALVISVVAGAAGLLLALAISRWLQQTLVHDLVAQGPLVIDTRVLTVYGAMLTASAMLSAVAPMRRLIHASPANVLRGARQGESRVVILREVLIALQAGISTALLATAIGFAGATLDTLAVDPGFAVEGRAAAPISASATAGEERLVLFQEILQNLRADGRVKSAALAGSVPVDPMGFRVIGIDVQGHVSDSGERVGIDINLVSDEYFRTLGIDMLTGRDFEMRDFDRDAEGVVIVNQAFVDTYWPGQQPLGLTIGNLSGEGPMSVIGVVANNRQRALRAPQSLVIYVPYTEIGSSGISAVVHATNSELALQSIRDAVQGTAAGLAQGAGMSLRDRLARFTARDRALTWLAVGAAVFATLLAVVGMYGIAAYVAHLRLREIGIRFALGATRPRLTRQFLCRGLVIAALGIAAGLVLALLAGRYLRGAIAGVDGYDPFAILAAGLLFALVGLLANLVPVWRAADVAPMEVLRDE